MVIYLRHAKHGTKVATDEFEAKADEKNGWTRYQVASLLVNPQKADEPVNKLIAPQPSIADRSELAGQWESKFGKKPHHKMSLERMQREIEAA